MTKDRISIRWMVIAVATVAAAGAFFLMVATPFVLAQNGGESGDTVTESVPVDLAYAP